MGVCSVLCRRAVFNYGWYGYERTMVATKSCNVVVVVQVDAIVVAKWDDVGTFAALKDIHPDGMVVYAYNVNVWLPVFAVVPYTIAIEGKRISVHNGFVFEQLLLCI